MSLPAVTTPPLADPNALVDAGSLTALRQAAAKGNPQALREAARQFESLFTSMMLKSMQQANFKDPLFGSDQGDLYQEMYDDQVAAEISKGKGLGLADMLVQQLQRSGISTADPTGAAAGPAGTTSIPAPADASTAAAGDTAQSAPDACPSPAQQAEFARSLWPEAQRAARQLGVSPVTLLAQAALETDWGRRMPHDADGGTSNNLFGIKAGTGWGGPEAVSSTREYSGGSAGTVKASFRSYDSARQCFQDYVDLLKSNPRYAAALGSGNDVRAFGSALQRGGYATDPAYAGKLTAVAGTLSRALTLKLGGDLPTTAGSGTLQRR